MFFVKFLGICLYVLSYWIGIVLICLICLGLLNSLCLWIWVNDMLNFACQKQRLKIYSIITEGKMREFVAEYGDDK